MTPVLAEMTKQEWYVLGFGALVVLAVAALGWRDVSRFGFRRVRAIAGVCFRESIRRRVLLITPLAIIGVVAVSQLTLPFDEQDAVRQTTRYALFATGLIVVVAGILLAATNLPKEIESRVIFTIVTKPTTRLEIVLGKVLGFAMVSGVILLIMGTFTFGYLQVRAWSLVRGARAELARMEEEDRAGGPAAADAHAGHDHGPPPAPATGPATAPSSTRPSGPVGVAAAAADPNRRVRMQTLRRYVDGGLLATKAIAWPADVQFYDRDPDPPAGGPPPAGEKVHWAAGGQNTYALVPVVVTPADRETILAGIRAGRPAYLAITLTVERQRVPFAEELHDLEAGQSPVEGEAFGPVAATARGRVFKPIIAVAAHTPGGQTIARDLFLNKTNASVPQEPVPDRQWEPTPGGPRRYLIPLGIPSPDRQTINYEPLAELLEGNQFNLEVSGVTPTYDYGFGPSPAALVLGNADPSAPPQVVVRSSTDASTDPPPVAGGEAGPRAPPGVRFLARFGRSGMQLIGRPPEDGDGSVAVYSFRGAPDAEVVGGRVLVQTKISVERAGDLDAERFRTTVATVEVRNRRSGVRSPAVEVEPQTGRTAEVAVPAEAVAGGDFDVVVRGRTPGQILGFHGLTASVPSVGLIRAEHTFLLNLFKALLVLWMLSVLVVAIAVFCSTFLSWPIAVVLTLLLLLGRWGVEALGESLDAGASRTVSKELFRIRDPAKDKAVTESLEALSAVLRTVGPVLPDVSRFPAFADIDRGVSIPASRVLGAAAHLLMYGLPLVLLTYVIFKRKEVAP